MYSVTRVAATPRSAPLTLFHSSSACSWALTPPRETDAKWSFIGRVEYVPRRLRAEGRRQKCTADKRPSQEHVRSRAELLAPIGGGIHLVFQFPEV